MNTIKKIFSGKRVLALTLVLTYVSGLTCGVYASGHTWASNGNVAYQSASGSQTVAFDKSDLDYLDNKIDEKIAEVSSGKEMLANTLLPLGTNSGSSLSGFSTFEDLKNAINSSQSIPNQTIGSSVSVDDDRYVLASSVTGSTINADTSISAATSDNLSLGTSAWVDGQLIVGTGADNNNYYNSGYDDGQKSTMSKLYPTGIVSEQSTTLNGNYQKSYSFSVSAPFDCEKVVVSCSGGNTNNGVAFAFSSSTGESKGVWLNAGYGTYTYNGKCNSVRLSNVTFPQGYPDIYCRINVKFYY